MAEMEPIENLVKRDRIAASKRPELKSPIGTLNQIGRHVYAFSGGFPSSTSEQTVLNFTTNSDYIVATLTMTAPIKMTTADIVTGYIRGYQLDFNSQTVGLYKVESINEDMPAVIEAQILIPPFTAVVLTCVDSGTSSTFLGTANLTGEVFNV